MYELGRKFHPLSTATPTFPAHEIENTHDSNHSPAANIDFVHVWVMLMLLQTICGYDGTQRRSRWRIERRVRTFVCNSKSLSGCVDVFVCVMCVGVLYELGLVCVFDNCVRVGMGLSNLQRDHMHMATARQCNMRSLFCRQYSLVYCLPERAQLR